MVEHDIAALIGQLLAAGLQGSVQDLIHASYIGAHGNDRRQILQGTLHGVVHPGCRHQEQKQGQHVDAALHQQHRTGERHRRNTQLEHHAGGAHKQRCFQLCHNRLLFHCPDFVGKAGQIPLLRIAGFQIPEGLDVLLNAVRTGHFRGHGPGLHLVLYPIAAHHDGSGYRNDPQRRQCHPPLKGKQAQGNEHGGDEGAEQTGDEVGAVLFQYLAVRHDGAGQVGKVSLAEKGQRQLPQPLRKGQAAGAALLIGGKIGVVVLEPCGQ